MSDIGHNGQLKSIVERIENIETQIKDSGKDRAEVYLEAKGNGWNVKVIRKIVALRKRDANERAEEDVLMETYLNALGMVE